MCVIYLCNFMTQFKSILFNSANTFQGQFSGKKMLVSNTYYCKGLTICATNMQHVDLSAQYSSQQGHSDVHAVLCLAEICCSWVCVHLHAERKIQRKHERKWNKGIVLANAWCTRLKYCTINYTAIVEQSIIINNKLFPIDHK